MKTSKKIIVVVVLLCLLAALVISVLVFKLIDWHIAKNDFYLAIENNDTNTVRDLLEEYPSLSNTTRDPILGFFLCFFMDYSETSALNCALYSQTDIELVKLLVENGADVNKHPFGNYKEYPLLLALRLGEYEVAWYLIDQGADFHVITESETAPYNLLNDSYVDDFEKVDKELQYQLFLRMIDQDVCLQPPSEGFFEGTPFLHMALKNIYVLEYLLTSSMLEIDINAVDMYQKTALMRAVQKQNYEACELLLAHGADITIKSQEGKSAYDYAAELEDPILIQMLTK